MIDILIQNFPRTGRYTISTTRSAIIQTTAFWIFTMRRPIIITIIMMMIQ